MTKKYKIDYEFIADGKIGKETIEAASVPTSKRGMEQMLRLRGGKHWNHPQPFAVTAYQAYGEYGGEWRCVFAKRFYLPGLPPRGAFQNCPATITIRLGDIRDKEGE